MNLHFALFDYKNYYLQFRFKNSYFDNSFEMSKH